MARTYPIMSPAQTAPGYPWGQRSSNTGNPTNGIRQNTKMTLTGTPKAVLTEDQTVTCTGTFAAGGVATITLDGTPYAYTVLLGDTPTDVANGLVALAVADPNYTVSNVGPVVDILSQTPGAWVGTITCGYVPAGVEDGALVQAVVTTGADANTFAVDDGTTTFTYTVLAGNTLADCATGLAALIDASPDYVASAHGTEIWVTDGVGTAFTFTDASTNNQTPGGAVLFQTINPAVLAANVDLSSPGAMKLDNVGSVALWCQLLAGTSYQVTVWEYNTALKLWHSMSTTLVNAAVEVIHIDVSSIDGIFVEMKTFVGGAVGLVYADGNRLTPGFQG